MRCLVLVDLIFACLFCYVLNYEVVASGDEYVCIDVLVCFGTENIAVTLHRLQITEIRRIHIEHLTANIKTINSCSNTLTCNKLTSNNT